MSSEVMHKSYSVENKNKNILQLNKQLFKLKPRIGELRCRPDLDPKSSSLMVYPQHHTLHLHALTKSSAK